MQPGLIEIEIRGFEKYRPRADIKDPWWFKSSNRIFEDDDLYDFTLEEMAVWWYLLAQASQQHAAKIRISVRKAAARIPEALLRGTIIKLADLGIVSVRNPAAIRTGHVHDPAAPRTLEERGEEGKEKRGGDRIAPPPLEASPVGENWEPWSCTAIAPVLEDVSLELQMSWREKFDHGWLEDSLVRAIAHHTKKEGVDDVRGVHGWQKRLDSWFAQERRPKLKAKLSEPRARAAPVQIEIPTVTREEVLSSASKMKLSPVTKLALARGLGGDAG